MTCVFVSKKLLFLFQGNKGVTRRVRLYSLACTATPTFTPKTLLKEVHMHTHTITHEHVNIIYGFRNNLKN